jgi:hypothetical protein
MQLSRAGRLRTADVKQSPAFHGPAVVGAGAHGGFRLGIWMRSARWGGQRSKFCGGDRGALASTPPDTWQSRTALPVAQAGEPGWVAAVGPGARRAIGGTGQPERLPALDRAEAVAAKPKEQKAADPKLVALRASILTQIASYWVINPKAERFRDLTFGGTLTVESNGMLRRPFRKADVWLPEAMVGDYSKLVGPGRTIVESFLLALRQAQPLSSPAGQRRYVSRHFAIRLSRWRLALAKAENEKGPELAAPALEESDGGEGGSAQHRASGGRRKGGLHRADQYRRAVVRSRPHRPSERVERATPKVPRTREGAGDLRRPQLWEPPKGAESRRPSRQRQAAVRVPLRRAACELRIAQSPVWRMAPRVGRMHGTLTPADAAEALLRYMKSQQAAEMTRSSTARSCAMPMAP